jgi:hypothetical protein
LSDHCLDIASLFVDLPEADGLIAGACHVPSAPGTDGFEGLATTLAEEDDEGLAASGVHLEAEAWDAGIPQAKLGSLWFGPVDQGICQGLGGAGHENLLRQACHSVPSQFKSWITPGHKWLRKDI